MTKIRYVAGDILNAPEEWIAHGVNAQGRMGSGVAKVLFERYPKMRQDYLNAYQSKGNRLFLGDIIVTEGHPHSIISAVTQEFYGYDKKLYVSYQGLAACFTNMDTLASIRGIRAIALPLIGAGLAGGDWKQIEDIIEQTVENFEPVVYLIDGKKP